MQTSFTQYARVIPDRRWSLPRVAVSARRVLLLTLLAMGVSLLLMWLYFPRYVAPLLIWHDDHYIYSGMSAEGFGFGRYFRSYPRPLAHVFIDLCGRLGPRAELAPVFGLAYLNAALLIRLVTKAMKSRPGAAATLTYLVVVFANPQFYWSVKEDPFAVPSFTCFVLALLCWTRSTETRHAGWWTASALLGATLPWFKEPYIPALVLIYGCYGVWCPGLRRSSLLNLAVAAASAMLSLAHTSHVWVAFNQPAGPTHPYFQNLHPLSLARGMRYFLARLIAPLPALVMLAGTAYAFRRNKKLAIACAVALLGGVSALLANATLPNHWLDHYAWLGALLFYSPLLMLGRLVPRDLRYSWVTILAGCAICLFALREYRPKPFSRAATQIELEHISQNLQDAWPILRAATGPRANSLVLGLEMTFHPFKTPSYVLGQMGPGRIWTVVVPDTFPESATYTTRLVHRQSLPTLENDPYDHVFLFRRDGALEAVWPQRRMAMSGLLPLRNDTPPEVLSGLRQTLEGPTPPPSPRAYLYARPDPIVTPSGGAGATTIYWWAAGSRAVEVHLQSVNGPLFVSGGPVGMAPTPGWVTPDTLFVLEDANTRRVLQQLRVGVTRPAEQPATAAAEESRPPTPPRKRRPRH